MGLKKYMKNLEEKYKKSQQEEISDLWNRLEEGETYLLILKMEEGKDWEYKI